MNPSDREFLPEFLPEFLNACRAIGTSTWSDALDALQVEGVIRGLAQRSGQGRFAGCAITVRERIQPLGSFAKSEMQVGRFLDAAAPGDVLMVAMDGAEVSTFGGLASLAASRKGLAAVIIDGGCRDLDEMRATGLWVASRHITPLSGKTRIRTEAIGEPVQVGGVTVRPGDLIVGDETGIVAIPRDRIAQAIALVAEERATDAAMEQALRSGASFSEANVKARYL